MSDTRFFSRLNYSSVNEDWRAEIEGLRPGPGERILCVTGSGSRPLDLLSHAPLRLVAIDRAPAQNHLLRLKVAAMRALPYEEYARFLGLHDSPAGERLESWDVVRRALDDRTRAWWDGRTRLLADGVLYAGRFERHIRSLGAVMRLLRPVSLRGLLEARDLEDQARFAAQVWDRAWWRAFLRIALSPAVSRVLLRDPAYFRRIAVPPGSWIHARMLWALRRWPAGSSFMVAFILTGRLPEADLPPYLSAAGFDRIRNRLDGLEIVDGALTGYLERVPERFDGFSLSDVPSYMDGGEFARLIGLVAGRAALGARVVVRQFLTRDPWPAGFGSRLVRLPGLEARLRDLDRSFAYEFFVAEARS